VLDDDQASVRRDDDAFGTERAVRRVGRLLVERRHRGDELPDEAQGRIAVEHDVVFRGRGEKLGDAHARLRIGDERQRASGIAQTLDGADLGKVWMTETRESADALAECEFERGNGCEFAPQAEDIEGVPPGGSDDAPAFAERIAEHHRRRRRRAGSGWIH